MKFPFLPFFSRLEVTFFCTLGGRLSMNRYSMGSLRQRTRSQDLALWHLEGAGDKMKRFDIKKITVIKIE